MLEACKQLFCQWNTQAIKYCHWKSNEHLMEGLDGETDLDVFVAPSDREKAERCLKECRYIECLTQEGHRYPNVFEWIGFDSATGRLIHVHLHYQIITGTKFCKEFVFPVDELMIESRVQDKDTGVYVANPDLEVIILHCRIALKAKNKHNIIISESDRRELVYLKERLQADNVRQLCKRLTGTDGEALYALIMKDNLSVEEWYRVFGIAHRWLKPYRKYSPILVFLRHNYYYYRYIFRVTANKRFDRCFINRKTFPNSRLSICMLGQDGSGKSTVSIDICNWLYWKVEAHRFYLGSGEHYMSLTKRLISKVLKSKKHGQGSAKIQSDNGPVRQVKRQKKSIKTFFAASLVACNFLRIARRAYKEVRRANRYMMRGGIPVFDRFPQLQFEGIYDGPKIKSYYEQNGMDFGLVKWLAKREYRTIEKIQRYQPRLVFKLMLSPEESIRRKPFENREMVTRKHEITQQLQFSKSVVYTVDATQDYQQEILFIKNQIWNAILQDNN